MKRGRLVAFEGVDGCGKSTQLRRLAEALGAAGCDVVTTREPTDGAWGRRIRAMAKSGDRVEPAEELRWFLEDRREHVARVIGPGLERGSVVLSDRYYLSTVAYQGARGHRSWQELLAESEAEFPHPDVAIVPVVAAERGLERVASRGETREPAFEEIGFLREVARIFDALDLPYVERLDGEGSPEEVEARVRACIGARLPELGGAL